MRRALLLALALLLTQCARAPLPPWPAEGIRLDVKVSPRGSGSEITVSSRSRHPCAGVEIDRFLRTMDPGRAPRTPEWLRHACEALAREIRL